MLNRFPLMPVPKPVFDRDQLRIVRKKVSEETAGDTLINFLSGRFTYWSRDKWLQSIADGRSQLNGENSSPDTMLQVDDILSLNVEDVPEPDVDKNYEILYEDEFMLVVNKPGNLPMHPAGTFFKNTLWHFLASKYGHIHLLNRLDRETSGIVLIALDKKSAGTLGKQFEARSIRKEYDVLIEGEVPWETLDACGFMGPAEDTNIRKKYGFTVDDDYQSHGKNSARTEFELLQKHNGFSHLHCKLHTGRTHQIRATLCSLGFPVVGDKIYGLDENFFLRFIEGALTEEDKSLMRIERQALHCSLMSFRHPDSKEDLVFTCELPKELLKLIK